MQVIRLTYEQYDYYAKIHSKRSYYHTTDYIKLFDSNNIIYVGLVDDNNNLYASSALVIYDLKMGYKYAYAPRGFLIDYDNRDLLREFTTSLKLFLKKENIVFVKLDPIIYYHVYDRVGNLISSDNEVMSYLTSLDYVHLGFNENFEANKSRYEVILHADNIESAYKNISRNAKRSIKDSSMMGISIHKGDISNIELFYNLVKKKTNKSIAYYKKVLSNPNASLYFAKIDGRIYMDNYRYLMDREFKINTDVNSRIQSNKFKNSNKLISKKIDSDRKLEIYNKHIITSTKIYKDYPNGLVIGTCLIVRNDRELWFLIDGYEEKLRNIYSSYLLKWEVIKKYIEDGVHTFNFGEISGNISKDNNKYYGIYFSKTSFGGNIYEYPGEFDLVVNKGIYNLFYNVMHYSNKINR